MKKSVLLVAMLSMVGFAGVASADENEVTGMMGTYKVEDGQQVASGMMTNGGLATAVDKDKAAAAKKDEKSKTADNKATTKSN